MDASDPLRVLLPYALAVTPPWVQAAATWLPVLLAAVASAFDIRTREIPDAIPISVFAWGMLAQAMGWSEFGWLSTGLALAVALAIGLPLFASGGFGGGDIKLIVAIAPCLGVRALLPALTCMAIIGGAIALIAVARGKKDIAYAPAIALGLAAFVALREVVTA